MWKSVRVEAGEIAWLVALVGGLSLAAVVLAAGLSMAFAMLQGPA